MAKELEKTNKDVFTTPEKTQKAVMNKRATAKGKKKIDKLNKTLDKLQIKYIPLNKLKPNEYNPNRQSEHEFELLCKSMEEDGFTQPIIAQQDGIIVDGEHRWRAANALKMKEIPVVFVEYTEAQRKIATLRHNRARGSEDIELSTDVLRDLEKLGALDWAQDSLMMSEDEITRLLDDIPTPEAFGKDHEYGMAWVPTDTEHSDEAGNVQDAVSISSEDAKRTAFNRTNALQKARTQEERELAQDMPKIYTITFNFNKEEYDIVKKGLGDTPAKQIVEWCKKNAKNN